MQSAADKLVSSLVDMAWREGAYISVQLLSSYHLGTQAEELLGDPKFQRHIADPSTNPQTTYAFFPIFHLQHSPRIVTCGNYRTYHAPQFAVMETLSCIDERRCSSAYLLIASQ